MPLIKLLHISIRGFRSKAGNGRFNSGISKRLQIVKENYPDIENVEISEDSFDNLEIGITTPNKRLEKNHTVAEFKKIERRFFKKEANPNLLTWSEKEQIRFLYNSDPTTWSPEKLSQCFPATADIIKKLVKAQWKPMTSQRIINHDANVKKNWKAIEADNLKLPDSLRTHIKSFMSRARTVNLPPIDKSLQSYNPSPASTEFLDIVKNFRDQSSPSNSPNTDECSVDNNVKPTHKGETYVLKQKDAVPLKQKYYTLQQYKKQFANCNSNGSELELKPKDSGNIMEVQPKIDSELLPKPPKVLPPTMYKKSSAETILASEHIDEVPLKITIPKEKMVKSKTHVYKVNDCYYDSSGNFIYKVPGMM